MIYKGLDDFSAADSQMLLKYKALYLLNLMRNMGYDSRKKFVDTCLTCSSFDINTQTVNKFMAFWEGREVTLIDEMEKIVEHLRTVKNEYSN